MSFESIIGNLFLGFSGVVVTVSLALSNLLDIEIANYLGTTIEWYYGLILLTAIVLGMSIKLWLAPKWIRYIAVIKYCLLKG